MQKTSAIEVKFEKGVDNEGGISDNKLGTRHVQCLLMFAGIAICYGIRFGMSVAIVAMTDTNSTVPGVPHFHWNPKINSMVLTSFFWGYIAATIPFGYLINKPWMSCQKLLGCGVFISGLLSTLVPLVAVNLDYVAVIVLRVACGLSQAALVPCIQMMLSRWAPVTERSRLGAFVYNGAQFGTVVAMPISGVLSASKFGWPSIFYLFGVGGMIWGIMFYIMGWDNPSEHPTICPREQRYIDWSLGRLDKPDADRKRKVPWLSILTSMPMLALTVAHCGNNWCFYTLLHELPTYMKFVLDFDIEQSGIISALPYLATWILGFPFSWVADSAVQKGVRLSLVRKVTNTIATWTPALAFLILSNIDLSYKSIIIAVLVTGVGINSGVCCGFQINHIDLSSNFAGTMMSITNCLAVICGTLAPVVCAIIVPDPTDVTQWRLVFYIAAAIYFLTNLFFVLFGQAEIQSWNDPNCTADQHYHENITCRISTASAIYDPTNLAIPKRTHSEDAIVRT